MKTSTENLILAAKEAALVIYDSMKIIDNNPDMKILEAYDRSPVFKHLMDAITQAEQQ